MSGVLAKKSIKDFQKIVHTKVASLGYLYRACQKQDQQASFHILTSAFSYLGNDGQPDYGAANESMNRIAEGMKLLQPHLHWSSMAWLGWAGIGMTRGSEFAALAANRRLRGVTREEGQEIFFDLIKGTPTAPINIMLAEGERKFYQPRISSNKHHVNGQSGSPNARNEMMVEWDLNASEVDLKTSHLTQGRGDIIFSHFPGYVTGC